MMGRRRVDALGATQDRPGRTALCNEQANDESAVDDDEREEDRDHRQHEPGQETSPGDDQIGPQPAHVRLERDVERPDRSCHEQTPAEVLQEHSELREARNVIGRKGPIQYFR